MTEDVDHGCYGLRVDGMPGAGHLLSPAPHDAPLLAVEQHNLADRAGRFLDQETFPLLGGGELVVERQGPGAAYYLPVPLTSAELVHPWLAAAAVPRNLHLGRLVMHGGLTGVADRGVAVVGDRGAGKSTMMASAALAGAAVYSDDVVVVDSGRAYCGPRHVDLRPGTAEQLPGLAVEPAREGSRDRAVLTPVPWSVALSAIVVLRWGPELSLHPIPPRERLLALQGHVACHPRADSRRDLLALVGVPLYCLTRPKTFSLLHQALAEVIQIVS